MKTVWCFFIGSYLVTACFRAPFALSDNASIIALAFDGRRREPRRSVWIGKKGDFLTPSLPPPSAFAARDGGWGARLRDVLFLPCALGCNARQIQRGKNKNRK